MQSFYVEEYSSMTLFIALNIIREQQDPSLSSTSAVARASAVPAAWSSTGVPASPATQTRDLPDHIVPDLPPVIVLHPCRSSCCCLATCPWIRACGSVKWAAKSKRKVHTQDKAFDPAPKKSAWKTSLPSRFSSLTAASNAAAASRPAARPGCARTSSARRPSTASPVSTSIPRQPFRGRVL